MERHRFAHFLLNVNIRVFHVVHEAERIRLLVRMPMPYLVADKLGPADAEGVPTPAPYTTNRVENGGLVHYLDPEALRRAPEGLAEILTRGLALEAGGVSLPAEVGRVRAYPAQVQPPFSSLDEAEASLSGPVFTEDLEAPYVGDTVVDVEVIYPTSKRVASYSLGSTLDPGLPGQGRDRQPHPGPRTRHHWCFASVA